MLASTNCIPVTITRDSSEDIKMRGLEVFVDDTFADDLYFGNTYSTCLEPGEHVIKVTNRLYTRRLSINLKDGQEANLQVGNYFGALGGFMMSVIGFGHYKVFVKQIEPVTHS